MLYIHCLINSDHDFIHIFHLGDRDLESCGKKSKVKKLVQVYINGKWDSDLSDSKALHRAFLSFQ